MLYSIAWNEILAISLMGLAFVGMILSAIYIRSLTAFFAELRQKEPEVWEKIGHPSLVSMLLLPFRCFRKFYAFYPVLKERRYDAGYRHAATAYWLLKAGLLFCVAMLGNVVALIAVLS